MACPSTPASTTITMGSPLFCVGRFGGPVPQAPWDLSLWDLTASCQNEAASPGGPDWLACRAGPESVLGLRPRRALSSAQVGWMIRGPAGRNQADGRAIGATVPGGVGVGRAVGYQQD